MEIMKTRFHYILCALAVVMAFVACVDNDDDIPMSRYQSNKLTAAQFLDENDARLGNFVTLLKRTSFYQMLSTYGNYTVFAPNNDAFAKFMAERGYATLDDIPAAVADTLVRNHLINGTKAYFTTDISEGNLGMNMAKLYISLSVETDTANNNEIIHYANETARLVEYDDSVSNGVVHIVSSMIPMTSDWLADVIAKDSTITIFRDALFATGLADTLRLYVDDSYPKWGSDKASVDSISELGKIMVVCKSGSLMAVPAHWPEYRYFKWTAFIEQDDVYKENGINDLNDLIAYAKTVYPEGKDIDNLKDRNNSLNKYVAYHIIDRVLPYDEVIMNSEFLRGSYWNYDAADAEEFYETMCPGAIMRFCIPIWAKRELYINRKGFKGTAKVKGIDVERGDHQTLNGMYYYVSKVERKLLEYNATVRNEVLNCRIRFDANVLSPDFQNCTDYKNRPARGRLGVAEILAFRLGYVKNWTVMGEDAFLGWHGDDGWWSSFKGNAMNINGIFDVTFKLPPVPSGTYEIRTGYTVGEERGVVQFYLNNVPCGIPADLRDYGGAPYIGYVDDLTIGTSDEQLAANKAIDKAMRNHGYMKAMDTWRQGGGENNTLRSHSHNLRKILTTTYLDQNQTYYIRARQVLSLPNCYWNFDYLELCPKSVYDSPQGEDQH